MKKKTLVVMTSKMFYETEDIGCDDIKAVLRHRAI